MVQGFASTLASRWDKLSDAERRTAVQTIAERAGSLAGWWSSCCSARARAPTSSR